MTVVIDTPQDTQTTAWWFVDNFVAERRTAPDMTTVVMEGILPLGSSPPLHVHDDLDDTMYLLEGEMLVRCGDEEQVVSAGSWISLPRGIPHSFIVTGDRDARVLFVHDNDSFRAFVREVGVPAGSHIVPPDPYFLPVEDLVRIGASHGLTIVGPPMQAPTAEVNASLGA